MEETSGKTGKSINIELTNDQVEFLNGLVYDGYGENYEEAIKTLLDIWIWENFPCNP